MRIIVRDNLNLLAINIRLRISSRSKNTIFALMMREKGLNRAYDMHRQTKSFHKFFSPSGAIIIPNGLKKTHFPISLIVRGKGKIRNIFANRISYGKQGIFFAGVNAIFVIYTIQWHRPGISINFSPLVSASFLSLTQHVALVPISVSNLEIVAATKIAFKYIQRRDVEDYSFAMGGRDPPFASLALGRWRAVRMGRRSETSAVLLKRSPAFCGKIESML